MSLLHDENEDKSPWTPQMITQEMVPHAMYPTTAEEEHGLLYNMFNVNAAVPEASSDDIIWDGLWNLEEFHGNPGVECATSKATRHHRSNEKALHLELCTIAFSQAYGKTLTRTQTIHPSPSNSPPPLVSRSIKLKSFIRSKINHLYQNQVAQEHENYLIPHGLVDEGLRIYKSSINEYGIKPTAEICACVVNMIVGRSGQLGLDGAFVIHGNA
ncbi:hypothetical protein OIU76_014217 [Salix suchowensis]|nr:hypothetical protein OIU76_014217 [Salix suchowensis]